MNNQILNEILAIMKWVALHNDIPLTETINIFKTKNGQKSRIRKK